MGPANEPELIEALEALLPQTQCGQCGFEGCTPYAQALAARAAECDRCPPGGDVVAAALAQLLGTAALPYDRARGAHLPPRVASIRETECIGCTKCIQACPIDAIVGAAERMHTVIRSGCSGCALCLPVCPVDCIDIVALCVETIDSFATPVAAASAVRDRHADEWRNRHDARQRRLDTRHRQREAQLAAHSAQARKPLAGLPPAVSAALARAAAIVSSEPLPGGATVSPHEAESPHRDAKT